MSKQYRANVPPHSIKAPAPVLTQIPGIDPALVNYLAQTERAIEQLRKEVKKLQRQVDRTGARYGASQ